jgi:hypothetical protein
MDPQCAAFLRKSYLLRLGGRKVGETARFADECHSPVKLPHLQTIPFLLGILSTSLFSGPGVPAGGATGGGGNVGCTLYCIKREGGGGLTLSCSENTSVLMYP